MRKFLVPLALAGALSFSLSGCAPIGGTTSVDANSQSTFDMNDIMFAQMMIPHHEQAVELASIAQSNTTNPAILDLANRIANAQQPEIDLMTSWLEETGAGLDMGHAMHMPGIVSDADMATIREAMGAEFDRLFLTHMIAHHKGAIDMANDVLNTTMNPEVRTLANAIVAAQTEEIAEMTALLTP